MAPDDVRVLEDTERRFEDGTVLRVRVLAVPESEKFPDGVRYRLHYGTEDGKTLIRYDNSQATTTATQPRGSTRTTSSPATTASKSASGTKSTTYASKEPQDTSKP